MVWYGTFHPIWQRWLKSLSCNNQNFIKITTKIDRSFNYYTWNENKQAETKNLGQRTGHHIHICAY